MEAESEVAFDRLGNEGRSAFRRAGPRVRSCKTEVAILRDPAHRGRCVACYPDRHPPRCFGSELTRWKLFAQPDVPLLDVECGGAVHPSCSELIVKSTAFVTLPRMRNT